MITQPTRRVNAGDPFWDLVATARRLQAPGGCAWDRAQTVSSLVPYLIEETWEVFEAIRSRRRRELPEELGDVLYTVLFLALTAERRGWGTLESLLTATREKMTRRHPHVFGPNTAATPHAAYRHWRASKRLEGPRRHSPSAAFRKRLVAAWERLRTHPDGGRRTVSGWSTRPSARPRRARARSRGRAPGQRRED